MLNKYPVTIQEMDRVAKSIGLVHYNYRPMRRVCLLQRLGVHVTIERYNQELALTAAALAIDPEQAPDWDASENVTVTAKLPPSPWRVGGLGVYTRGKNGLWTDGYHTNTDSEIALMFDLWMNPQRSDRGDYIQQVAYWNGDK